MQLNTITIERGKEVISHDAVKKLLIAEISDLGLHGFDRLYDDACDVGFALRNPRTGNTTRWVMVTEIRDTRENELLGWMCEPCSESVRKNPLLAGYSFNIIND